MSGDYLFFHYCMVDSKNISNSIKINVDFQSSIKELIAEAKAGINSTSKNVTFEVLSLSKAFGSKPLSEELPLKLFFEKGDDIYCQIKLDSVKPLENPIEDVKQNESSSKEVEKKKDDDLKYIVLSKYSFYDDGKFVKVNVPLLNVGTVKDNVSVEFKNRAFTILVKDLNGSNFRFGIGKLSYPIFCEESKIIVKANEILVKIHKKKMDEIWSSLQKVKMVCEDDDD